METGRRLASRENAVAEMSDDGLPQPRRLWAAAAIWAALLLAVLDATIVNVALPAMAGELGAPADRSIWIVSAYQIAITMLLLPLASLGEKFGFRRVYLTGIGLFVGSSLCCAVAPDLVSLSISRFVQGIGAAAIMGVNGALVRLVYPRVLLGRGIGYNALVIAVASAAGPSIAALVLVVASWRWLFAINVPVGIAAFAIGLNFLPPRTRPIERFDWGKAVLLAGSFAAFFFSASGFAHGARWTLPSVELAAAVAGFGLSWYLSRTENAPLLPVDLLRTRHLRLSYITSACSFAAQMIAYVTLPFLLLGRLGLGHGAIGLLLTPWPLATAIAAPVAGRLVERFPAGLLGSLGLVATATGLLLLAILPPHVGVAALAASMALAGFGFGFFQTPNNRVMLGTAPAGRSGAAAGMLATARLVGQTGGALCVALIFRTIPTTSSLPLLIATGLAVAAAIISIRRVTGRTSVPSGQEDAVLS